MNDFGERMGERGDIGLNEYRCCSLLNFLLGLSTSAGEGDPEKYPSSSSCVGDRLLEMFSGGSRVPGRSPRFALCWLLDEAPF